MKKSSETNASVTTKLSSTEPEQDPNKNSNESEYEDWFLFNWWSYFDRNSSAELEKKSSRENFIFMDEYNLLYHFYVEGRTIKEVATFPPDVWIIICLDLFNF